VAAGLLLLTAVVLAPMLASPGRGALDIYDGMTPLPLLRCIGGFILGVLAFRLARQPSVIAVAGLDRMGAVLLGALVLGLAAGVGDLVLYPLFPAIVIACFANRGRLARALGGGVVYRLGVWSYAIYLLHPDVFRQVAALASRLGFSTLAAPGAIACGAIGFAIVLMLAALSHHLIEVPGRRLVRGWHVGVGHVRAGRPIG
jgi:peptidoglycan/LPS O-acetylase OafA/YrhL